MENLLNKTLYDIINSNPKMYDFFIANGFDNLKNKKMLQIMGKNIKLGMALKSKKINPELFLEKVNAFLEKDGDVDISLEENKISENEVDTQKDVLIEGVLPCPIRIPLLEGIKKWVDEQNKKNDYLVKYELQSANLGLDWIIEKVKTGDVNKVPDVLLSAGFELFFDKNLMGQYMENGVFETYLENMNKDFYNENIDLHDPKKRYAIMGVVPAVFLVNKTALKNRKIPQTWDDILTDEFENSVALPMADLDLFNALIVMVYKEYGDDGIKKLAKVYQKNLHPAQMVKTKTKSNEAPAISIIPYFFSQMVNGASDLKVVWPKDGALLSPIFMITKKEKADKIKPFLDLFLSEKIGNLFSANGKFPTTNPNVDNHLEKSQNFKWVGWDFIYKNDIGEIIRNSEKLFNEEIKKYF